jgi:hypothetical protein
MNDTQLVQTLTESFIALSDEVQSLIDRKTILEHKLRYAHEQVCRAFSRFCLFAFPALGSRVMIWFLALDLELFSYGRTADGEFSTL